VVGCGNIGALYDFKKEGIKTHVKAFYHTRNFLISVFDQNAELAKEIADYYKIETLQELNNEALTQFKVVVISTPTSSHYELLKKCLQLNVPVIVCEKPITDSTVKLEELAQLKKDSTSKVLVNYFRRFHPCYHQLRQFVKEINEELTNIQVTYQRGFLNNATHALDMLNFLFGESLLQDIKIGSYAFDEFKNDPTVSLTAKFRSVPVSIQGLQFVKHSFFEIRLWFQTKFISIENSGQSIRVYSTTSEEDSGFYLPLINISSPFDKVNAIEDAMKYLVDDVNKHLEDPRLEDNFETSFLLNQQSLKIIEDICRN
jgi:predicted dehydrogenase